MLDAGADQQIASQGILNCAGDGPAASDIDRENLLEEEDETDPDGWCSIELPKLVASQTVPLARLAFTCSTGLGLTETGTSSILRC